ncbi:MAG: creatininase family protein, partial [Acetobacteraceae bacterium]
AARKQATAILPVGSLEQHGPHLPVNTDTASANEAALRAARMVCTDIPVAVLPGLWLGMSEHHFPFGATISIDFSAYRAILVGIARSLKVLGFGRLLIVNGHGGNVDALAVIARELALEFVIPIVVTTPWHLAQPELRAVFESSFEGRHACEGETSVMLAISADTVRRDKFDDAMRQRPEPLKARRGFTRFYSFSEIAPSTGVNGDPRTATAAKGERFLAIQARELAAAIVDDNLWTTPDPVWRPGRGQQTTSGRAE